MQTFSIMGNRISAFELREADVVVKPSLTGLSSASFASRAQAISAGHQAMLAWIDRLRHIIQVKSK
jgi:NTE family protein